MIRIGTLLAAGWIKLTEIGSPFYCTLTGWLSGVQTKSRFLSSFTVFPVSFLLNLENIKSSFCQDVEGKSASLLLCFVFRGWRWPCPEPDGFFFMVCLQTTVDTFICTQMETTNTGRNIKQTCIKSLRPVVQTDRRGKHQRLFSFTDFGSFEEVWPPALLTSSSSVVFLLQSTVTPSSNPPPCLPQVPPSWVPSWPAVWGPQPPTPLTPQDLLLPLLPPPTGLDPIRGLPRSGSPIHMKVWHTHTYKNTHTHTCRMQRRVLGSLVNPGSWFGIRLRWSH